MESEFSCPHARRDRQFVRGRARQLLAKHQEFSRALMSAMTASALSLRTSKMAIFFSKSTGDILNLTTSYGFVVGASELSSWLGQHGTAGSSRASIVSISVSYCGARCVRRTAKVGRADGIEARATLEDRFEAHSDGACAGLSPSIAMRRPHQRALSSPPRFHLAAILVSPPIFPITGSHEPTRPPPPLLQPCGSIRSR